MVPPRARRALLLAVGLLLVFNPFYVDGLIHTDDPNRYEYYAQEVTFGDEGSVDVPAGMPALADGEEVGCLVGDGRVCGFERYVLEHGPVTVEADPGWNYEGRDNFVYLEGSFYQTRAEFVDGDPTRQRLSLERVARETALDSAATPFRDASAPARRVITDGPVERQRAIPDARTLIAHEGDYYVVYAKYGRFLNDESFAEQRAAGNGIEGAVSALGVLVGLQLVAGWVARVT